MGHTLLQERVFFGGGGARNCCKRDYKLRECLKYCLGYKCLQKSEFKSLYRHDHATCICILNIWSLYIWPFQAGITSVSFLIACGYKFTEYYFHCWYSWISIATKHRHVQWKCLSLKNIHLIYGISLSPVIGQFSYR